MSEEAGETGAKKPHRPVRDNIESLAVAVALALLLKFFLIEAYQIPTSSMQPALMGDSQKGVFDRILVDKLAFLLREPRRWEVAVFKYPLHQAQNYIKRIWGLPGEWILVQGGDVWQGSPGDFPAALRPRSVLRKPRSLQERLWLEVYDSDKLPDTLGRVLREPRESAGRARMEPEEEGALLEVRAPGGMVAYFETIFDDLAHGYHPDASRAVRAALDAPGPLPTDRFYPSDLRLRLEFEPLEGLERLLLEIEERPGRGTFTYRLELPVGAGEGPARLLANDRLQAETKIAALRPGERHRVEFWSWDDRLLALLDGEPILTADLQTEGEELQANQIRLGAASPGKLRLHRLRLDRDIYYTPTDPRGRKTGPWLHLGERHFLMLGDNTRQSADGRAWQQLTLQDPTTGRAIQGNYRPFFEGDPYNADWNPVFVPSARALVFTDNLGEEHVLRPRLPGTGLDWMRRAGQWITPTKLNSAASLEWVAGVPREFIVGKGFAVFYPLNPFPVDSDLFLWTRKILGRAWRLRFIN